ncbi:hypothetical protein [Streptomyces sp. V1I6]|uniref:hypothetical protein n=1 Tax=Streptomyces sp. V1I6 TaxID=3042273 RepID=UPI002783CE6D|nr:hypothetical protein [Streptomyces sp. V1I6]MDQ0843615.1 hypothetical protein [Streptomyces sp. V1I6]
MDAEVIAAYIAGGGALLGVALGIAGTLAAARVQARAAYAQADAALEAARAQARATYASSLYQHNQAARGTAYARLVDSGHSFIRALADIARIDEGTASEPRSLTGPYTELHRAESAVKVWAPEHVRAAANELASTAWRITVEITKWDRDLYEGWHALYAAAKPVSGPPPSDPSDPPIVSAYIAQRAMDNHRRHVDAYHREGRPATPLIADDVHAWEVTAESMRAAFTEAVTAGILTPRQAVVLAQKGAETTTPPREDLFNKVAQADRLLDRFAEQAREDLGHLAELFQEIDNGESHPVVTSDARGFRL